MANYNCKRGPVEIALDKIDRAEEACRRAEMNLEGETSPTKIAMSEAALRRGQKALAEADLEYDRAQKEIAAKEEIKFRELYGESKS